MPLIPLQALFAAGVFLLLLGAIVATWTVLCAACWLWRRYRSSRV